MYKYKYENNNECISEHIYTKSIRNRLKPQKNYSNKGIHNKTEQSLDEILTETIYDIHIHIPFSTIPYYIDSLNSIHNLKKYNSGTCVALSLKLQMELKKKHIISYIIPATIPKMYQLPELYPLSHVAVCIPINSTDFYIIDIAFYFIKPLFCSIHSDFDYKKSMVSTKNIYSNKIDDCYIHTIKQVDKTNSNLHNHQSIRKGTYYIECCYNKDTSDTWNYYITELMNPDQSINYHFLDVKKFPFISIIDKDYNMILYIKYKYEDGIYITLYGKEYYFDSIKSIPKLFIKKIKPILKPYLTIKQFYSLDNISRKYNII